MPILQHLSWIFQNTLTFSLSDGFPSSYGHFVWDPCFFWSTLYIVLIKWSNRNLDLYQIITFQTFSTIGRLVRMQSEAALGGSAFLFRSSMLGSGIKCVRCVPDPIRIVTLPLKLYVPYWVITSVLQLWHRCTSAVTKFGEGHVIIDPQSVAVLVSVFIRAFSKYCESFRKIWNIFDTSS